LLDGTSEENRNLVTGEDLTVSFGSTVSWSGSTSGLALVSDGSSTTGYVSLGDTASDPLFGNGDYTVTFQYTFLETPASLEGQVTAASNSPYPFAVRYESSKVMFMHNTNKLTSNLSSVLFRTFTFSAVFDPDVGQLFYINGELAASNSYTTEQASGNQDPLYIHTGYNGTRVTKGQLHYLYIHDRALNAEEVRRLHTKPFQFLSSTLNRLYIIQEAAEAPSAARRRIISKAPPPPWILEKLLPLPREATEPRRPGMPPPWIERPWATQPVGGME
jgi:hypothetical protein